MSKATALLNIPDQIYVGTKGGVPFDVQDPPLAFATQVSADAAFEKRKETVTTWMGPRFIHDYVKDADGNFVKDERGYNKTVRVDRGEMRGVVLDNVPLSGFTFEKSVSRWTTSNKWFAINDPRGFQLQISADNLGDILLNAAVSNGELLGEYVWAKDKQNIFLCRTSHESYQMKMNPSIDRKKLLIGDVVMIGSDETEYVYLGAFYSMRFGTTSRYVDKATGKIITAKERYGHYGYHRSYEARSFAEHVADPRPNHLFLERGKKAGFKMYRDIPKRYRLVAEGEPIIDPTSMGIMVSNFSGAGPWLNTSIPINYGFQFFTTFEEAQKAHDSVTDWVAFVRNQSTGRRSDYVVYGDLGDTTQK